MSAPIGKVCVSNDSVVTHPVNSGVVAAVLTGIDFAGDARTKTLRIFPKYPSAGHLTAIRDVYAVCQGDWATESGLAGVNVSVGWHRSDLSEGDPDAFLDFSADGAKWVGLLPTEKGPGLTETSPYILGLNALSGELLGASPMYVTVTADVGAGHTTADLLSADSRITVYVDFAEIERPSSYPSNEIGGA